MGDNRNYGEKEYELSMEFGSTLHPFFIEQVGWRFLQFDGIYWKRAMWFLKDGYLMRVNFVQELPNQ